MGAGLEYQVLSAVDSAREAAFMSGLCAITTPHKQNPNHDSPAQVVSQFEWFLLLSAGKKETCSKSLVELLNEENPVTRVQSVFQIEVSLVLPTSNVNCRFSCLHLLGTITTLRVTSILVSRMRKTPPERQAIARAVDLDSSERTGRATLDRVWLTTVDPR